MYNNKIQGERQVFAKTNIFSLNGWYFLSI